jgi:histone H3/H4
VLFLLACIAEKLVRVSRKHKFSLWLTALYWTRMAEEYARSISKQVVAQLAEREGFQLAHGNALDALADVLNRFIREIGTYAKDYAELQGRTDVNVLDLVCPSNFQHYQNAQADELQREREMAILRPIKLLRRVQPYCLPTNPALHRWALREFLTTPSGFPHNNKASVPLVLFV